MNAKIALGALVLALTLSGCGKKEETPVETTAPATTEPAPADTAAPAATDAAPAAGETATPPADTATPPADAAKPAQ